MERIMCTLRVPWLCTCKKWKVTNRVALQLTAIFDVTAIPFLIFFIISSIFYFEGLKSFNGNDFYLLDVFTYIYFGLDIVKGVAAIVCLIQIQRRGNCGIIGTYLNMRWMAWVAHFFCLFFGNLTICEQLKKYKGQECGLLGSTTIFAFFLILTPVDFFLIYVVYRNYRIAR